MHITISSDKEVLSQESAITDPISQNIPMEQCALRTNENPMLDRIQALEKELKQSKREQQCYRKELIQAREMSKTMHAEIKGALDLKLCFSQNIMNPK